MLWSTLCGRTHAARNGTWPYSAPGRVEDKYERWGDQHPVTYDRDGDHEALVAAAEARGPELGAPTADDIEF